MQKGYRKKAGITVFLVMILLLTSSFFFALLETARVRGLSTKAQSIQDMALESVFAEYQRKIYGNYGLLLFNGSLKGEEFQIRNLECYLEKKNAGCLYSPKKELQEFYQMRVTECQIPCYQLATDDGGKVFRRLAVAAAKREAATSLTEDFSDKILEKKNLEEKNGRPKEHIENAAKAESEAIRLEEENTNDISAPNKYEDVKNPVDEAKKWKKSRVLSMVVRDEGQLSKKAVSVENTLERRTRKEGNLPVEKGILDEMWFYRYLERYMGAYGKVRTGHALDYEMEYILCGMSTDRENLEKTAKNLIEIREISNLAYLLGDAGKCLEAEELAAALMGWTMNPAVIAVTKLGILGSWAYVESILDVRALLEGNKIAWIKNSEQWTSDIGGIEESVEGFAMAKNCENGWDYMKYIEFLLCLHKDSDVNYRSMDIIEVNINLIGEEQIKMDEMLVAVQTDVSYEAEPLFWKYVHIGSLGMEGFSIKKEGRCGYL